MPTTWVLCARPAHVEHATCAGCARDRRATGRLCAQQCPRPGHYTRSVRVTDELKSHLFLVHFSVCFSFKNE